MNTNIAINQAAVTRAAPMPLMTLLRAYATEAKYETLNALRNPAFAVPFLAIPVAVYLLFGIVILPANTEPGMRNYLFSGFSVLAAMMPSIFIGCMGIALEREGGLLKLKRALPMPAGANLVAKLLTSMIVSTMAIVPITIAGLTIGQLTLSLSQVLILELVMIVGTIPFFTIGFFIGSVASGSAAPAYGNLVFLPMMWLSGLFIPLPKFLEPWAVVWPAFHLNQVALTSAGVSEFSFFPPAIAAAVLVGVTVLFGGLGIWRVARVG
jgi:ABC-2 type transport system permease protein